MMEKQTARNWYRWLWLSPLLTIPTLLALGAADPGYEWICGGHGPCDWAFAEKVTILIAVLGSALWHLVLLIPTLNKEYPFVRWHGRQALLLAGVRTAVPLVLGLALLDALEAMFIAILVLMVIWLGGTLWGQRQAARGECSLMRWFGQEELLLTLREADVEIQTEEQDTEALIGIIRFSRDPKERRSALAELRRREMVEPL